MLEAHVVHEETQWLGMKEWPEDAERQWDDDHKDNVYGIDHEDTGKTKRRRCCTRPTREKGRIDVSEGRIAEA